MTDTKDILLVGRLLIDRYYLLKEFPQRGQEAIITGSFERVGGCTFNAAATIKNLGGNPLILSPLCNDQRGEWIKTTLRNQSFQPDLLYEADGETEYCVVLLDNQGERTFLTYSGSKFLLTELISQSAVLTRPAYTHLSGYSVIETENSFHIIRLLENLKNAGSSIFFDPSPLVKEIARETLQKVLELTDIFCPNRVELQAVEAFLDLKPGLTDRKNFRDGQVMVVKDGARGAEVFTREENFTVPAFPVQVIDSTGAGDSFGGGLLAALANGADIRTAVKTAAACGAITASALGPQVQFDRNVIYTMQQKELE